MKKIDLHIHTISTVSDKPFDFDLSKLKEYVEKLEIDCIAITNHNTFDLTQYQSIRDSLDIVVLPGIEIDLEGGHLLLISDDDDLFDFSRKCNVVDGLITSNDESITKEKFKEIYVNLDRYILIPHYNKKPALKPEVISDLDTLVSAGEVSSIKKFKSCVKDEESLVPVIFSDSRYYTELETFSTKQTFVDLEDISFAGIKSCLTDKQKVFLSKDEGNDFFQATDEGLKLSTGLNVILGERSTGKTFTLNKVFSSFENIKYIRQFSLLQKDEEKFKELLSRRHSSVSEGYLDEFKKVVDDMRIVDLKQNEIELENYLTTLLKFASESEKDDAFSNTKLFSETPFELKNLVSLKQLISATKLLKENSEYKEIIAKHLDFETLQSLEIDLTREFLRIEEDNRKKEWLNSIMATIKSDLKLSTSTTSPEDVDFYKVLMDYKKVEKFNKIVNSLKSEKEIDSIEIRNFKIVANTIPISSATQLQKICKRRVAFSSAFQQYSNPYAYLAALKGIDLEETELYKYFVEIDYKTLNKHGFEVSGGEMSEFNLLHEINDALKFDMLLIDEPESSFDNIFLKNEVNTLLREIAKSIPVIIVTHNNTVGASIKPHYIACTTREIIDGEIVYKVFSGHPADKQLSNVKNEKIDNYDVMLNCLEAGNVEYNKRRTETYEILKN